MGKKLIATALLIAALIWLPSPAKNINNSEQAAASNVGQMRQQRAEKHNSDIAARNLLTTEASTQVNRIPENAPTKPIAAVETEAPNSEKAKAVNVQTSVKASEPEPQVTQATGCEKYRDIIDNYSWNVTVAIAVCNAESSGNANTANLNDYHSFAGCRGSFGLFQINCSHGKVYDPVENIRIAAAMYEASGWKPWAATTCKYKVKCY